MTNHSEMKFSYTKRLLCGFNSLKERKKERLRGNNILHAYASFGNDSSSMNKHVQTFMIRFIQKENY